MEPSHVVNGQNKIIVWLVMLVQFVNALEFMVIALLGTFLVKAFQLDLNQIGLITGAYTFAGVLAGLVGHRLLDRLDKRQALLFCLGMLASATFLSIFCTNLFAIMALRLIAGCFVSTTLVFAMSILMDCTPKTHLAILEKKLQRYYGLKKYRKLV